MKIDEKTPQDMLQKLYEGVLRQEFLRSTPLNLRQFLGFLVLFLLFPAMVFGFWAGIGVTGGFCIVLFALLYLQHADWGMLLAGGWCAVGLLALAYVTRGVLRHGRELREKRRRVRSAEPGAAKGELCPIRKILNWHKGKDARVWKASFSLEAPAEGIYAFLLSLDSYSGARFGTDGTEGCCTVQANGQKGGRFDALLLYKLAAGRHLLEWRMAVSPSGEKPTATLTQLNKVCPD